jgi:hypothetical protein
MSTPSDQPPLGIQLPGVGTNPVAPSGGAAHAGGPVIARGDAVHESDADNDAVGRRLLEAIRQFMSTQVAVEEPVVVAPEPPTRDVHPASPFDIEAALAAAEHATTEDEIVAAVATFLGRAATLFTVDADPVAVLTSVFGPECVADVAEVCAAAVVDLEAEAAVTGGVIRDHAARRIARSMVDRVTMRAGRTTAHAPRARGTLRVRIQRAPRARRARRSAVRLSAVASAGDGPPPPRDPLATSRSRDHAQLERDDKRLSLVAHVDDVVERISDLLERELRPAPRGLFCNVERRRCHWYRAPSHEAGADRPEAWAEFRGAAVRLRCSLDQSLRFRHARGGKRAEGVRYQRGPRRPAIETPHEVLRTLEVRR